MVDFIELLDSDSSFGDENQVACYSEETIERDENSSDDASSPLNKTCKEQFESSIRKDGKPVHFWKSFNISKRSFNDDESIQKTASPSQVKKKALSRTVSSAIGTNVFPSHKESTLQKRDDDDKDDDDDDDDDGSSDIVKSNKHFSFLSGDSYSDDDDEHHDDFSLSDQKHSQDSCDASQNQHEDINEQTDDDIARSGCDIMRKYGGTNFGTDPSIRFSYASSKLFNNIAKANPDIDETASRLLANRMATTENRHKTNPYAKRKPDSEKSGDQFRDFVPIKHGSTELISMEYSQSAQQEIKVVDKSSDVQIMNISSKQDELKSEVPVLWERILEIDPDFCKPPSPCHSRAEPVVHYLTKQTRPDRMRQLIPVNSVFREPFASFWRSKFHSFNELQSELVAVTANSDESLVVSAPTAAGKTCIFEMALCRLLAQLTESLGNVTNNTATFEIPNNKKILYIAPNKALCEERYEDWTRRLQSIFPSICIALVTGDSDSKSFRQIASSHLILSTPEKWDSLTRRWTDHFFLIGSVKLLLVDEVHMLGDEQRGGCLESLICRMKTVQQATQSQALSRINFDEMRIPSNCLQALASKMRICAVSATAPNISDIASFLDVKEAFYFDDSYRPVELKTHVVGLGYKGKNQYLFDKNLDRHVPELLDRFSDGKPSIVFCHSKKDTERLASDIASRFTPPTHSLLEDISTKTNSGVLQKCLKRGIAFHHAGMDADNRRLVEHTFSKGLIKCLCATSTLAVGVNLPAHLVIIKGTSAYRGASMGHVDIDIGTILQMIGRAGRPGYDSSGTAVIMTDMRSKSRYEKLSTGLEAVESKLLSQLTETLNTEVSQRVLRNVKQATDWLKGTFFFNCIRRNPGHYGLFNKTEQERESYLMKRCLQSLQELHNANIIKIHEVTMSLSPEDASHVMNHHMVPFEAMKLIIGLAFDSGPLQLLQILSKLSGLHFPVRKAEKVLLNEAHKEIKYKREGPISKIRIQTSEDKAFVLLQAAIGQIYFEDYTLRQEMSSTVEYAKRMLSAIEEYSVVCSMHGSVALQSLLLRRSLNTSLWSANDGVLNQIKGVGQKSVRRLAEHNIKTFADVLSHTSDDIEQACGRSSPFGQELRAAVRQIFQSSLTLSAYVDETDRDNPLLICTLKHLEETNKSSSVDASGVVSYTLIVHFDGPKSLLMFREDICDECIHSIKCPKTFGRLYIRLVCNLVGMDEQLTIDGSGKITNKSIFTVSPKVKRTKLTNQDSDRTRLHQMDKFVEGIDDIRVHKRKTTCQNTSIAVKKSQTTNNAPSSAVVMSHSVNTPVLTSLTNTRKLNDGEVVTPSPVPITSVSVRQLQSVGPIGKSPIPVQHNSSWLQNKSAQTTLQRRVFKSTKDNPFASFNCDPNNLENQMQMQSNSERLSLGGKEYGNHLINHVNAQRNASHSDRFSSGRFSRVSRPNPLVHALKRKRLGQTPVRLQNQELLRMKAEEQQAYAAAQGTLVPNNSTPSSRLLESSAPSGYCFNAFPSNSDSAHPRLRVRSFANTEASYGSLEVGSAMSGPINMPIHHDQGLLDNVSTYHVVDHVPVFDQIPSATLYTSRSNYMLPSSYDYNALDRPVNDQVYFNYDSPNLRNHYSDHQVAFLNSVANQNLQRYDRADVVLHSHLVPINNDHPRLQPDLRNITVNSMCGRRQHSSGTSFSLTNNTLLYPLSTGIANPLQTAFDNNCNENQMFDEAFL